MKVRSLIIFSFLSLIAVLVSCDMRSGTAKEEMEKWQSSPTPVITPSPTPTPIDPADMVQVDTSLEGDLISANGHSQNATKGCTKFNRLIVNGDNGTIKVTGVCRQIMINGDRNKITADAAMEFVLNGSENIVKYSRYPNGKQPSVIENQGGNVIEKVSAGAVTTGQPGRKILK